MPWWPTLGRTFKSDATTPVSMRIMNVVVGRLSYCGLDEHRGGAPGLRLAPELERPVIVWRSAPRYEARPRRSWGRHLPLLI